MKHLIIIFLLSINSSISAQSWTLEQCIDSAITNSFIIKSNGISSEILNINYNTSKYSFLPTLNGGASHGYSNGRYWDQTNNQLISGDGLSSNFYLSSNLVLFSGLQNYYGYKISAINYKSQQYNAKIDIRNLKIDIASAYLQVLLNQEILNVANDNLKITRGQKERVEKLVLAGQETNFKLLEVSAQEENDKYTLLKAKNDLSYGLLLLQQVINVPYTSNFSINAINTTTSTKIESINMQSLPEIEKLNLEIEKQTLQLKQSKLKFYPTLSISGNLGSRYSDQSIFFAGNDSLKLKPLSFQIEENFTQSSTINLNIPIFNGNVNRAQMKINALELEQSQINKSQQTIELNKTLEKLRLDLLNLQARLQSAQSVFKSMTLNFNNSQIQFENGIIPYSELIIAQNKLFNAKSEAIQVRYQIAISQLILSFYSIGN